MRIYPAVHYTMGGLWVDYDLMTNVPGLFVLGEANFSDHGANRLGASALMQGLADGYFVLPYTIGDYLAPLLGTSRCRTDDPAFKEAEAEVADRVARLPRRSRAPRSVDHFHRELGKIMWDYCGMARTEQGLEKALSRDPGAARGVLEGRPRARRRRVAQPVAREGRPGRRLPRARRADVPRRPAPRGVLRRPLPRRAPDRRGRGAARRRALRLRRAPGSGPATEQRRARTRSRSSSSTSTSPSGATSRRDDRHTMQPHPARSGARPARRRRAASRPTTRPASATTCRSSRCSTSSTSG